MDQLGQVIRWWNWKKIMHPFKGQGFTFNNYDDTESIGSTFIVKECDILLLFKSFFKIDFSDKPQIRRQNRRKLTLLHIS